MVNGSQMTVKWHVDDLKILHADSGEVTKFLNHFTGIYGDRMTVNRGKVHDYLGMDIDFSTSKALKIGMMKYIKKYMKTFLRKSRQRTLRQLQTTFSTYMRITKT